MKVGVIIQARMGSSRLPEKVLMEIEGKPIFCHIVERLKNAKNVDEIILATTELVEDNILCELANDNGIKYYRGSSDDVLSRFYFSSRYNSLNVIVRITCDCPLVDAKLLDEMIEFYKKNTYEMVSNAPNDAIYRTYPRGLDIEMFSLKQLELAYVGAEQRYQREHVTPFIYENCETKYYYKDTENNAHLRWTIDTMDDYILIKEIYSNLYKGKHDFYYRDILELYKQKPELLTINSHIIQKSHKE